MDGRFLAFDLGAESGRAMAVSLEDDGIALAEVHRSPNGPVRVPLPAGPAGTALVDPDQDGFLPPGDMPRRLADFCARSGQGVLDPGDVGRVARCILESLALKYRWVIERLEHLVGRRVGVIHIIGGGAQNAVLNQFTADACGRLVFAGPIEATAIGNGIVQALARGRLASLQQGRDLVRASFPLLTFEPRATSAWDEAYGRFQALIGA